MQPKRIVSLERRQHLVRVDRQLAQASLHQVVSPLAVSEPNRQEQDSLVTQSRQMLVVVCSAPTHLQVRMHLRRTRAPPEFLVKILGLLRILSVQIVCSTRAAVNLSDSVARRRRSKRQ